MRDLNAVSSEYKPNAATELENEGGQGRIVGPVAGCQAFVGRQGRIRRHGQVYRHAPEQPVEQPVSQAWQAHAQASPAAARPALVRFQPLPAATR